MAGKKNNFIMRSIIDLFTIVSSIFKFISNFMHVFEVEASEARKNLVLLILLLLVSLTLFVSIWVCLLLMCFLYFVSLHLSWMFSLAIIVILNILLLIITVLVMLRAKNNLSFPQTRHLIRKITNN